MYFYYKRRPISPYSKYVTPMYPAQRSRTSYNPYPSMFRSDAAESSETPMEPLAPPESAQSQEDRMEAEVSVAAAPIYLTEADAIQE